MQSESSDLRSPAAARQRGWDVLGGGTSATPTSVAPRAAQSNTWSRVPMPTSRHLLGLPIIWG
jgi:hypothetical protein